MNCRYFDAIQDGNTSDVKIPTIVFRGRRPRSLSPKICAQRDQKALQQISARNASSVIASNRAVNFHVIGSLP